LRASRVAALRGAQIIGEPAGHLGTQQGKCMMLQFLALGVFMLIDGFLVGPSLGSKGHTLITALLVIGLPLLFWRTKAAMDKIEQKRIAFYKGERGERHVEWTLESLGESFYVCHNLLMRKGKSKSDIDHIVIGPTGVFVIETKHYRGVVKSDGNGGITVNGKRYKNDIATLISRTVWLKEQLSAAGITPPYIRAVMAFPIARVEAPWGTTGNAHCMRSDDLCDYIENRKYSAKLSNEDVEKIANVVQDLEGVGGN
jgi:Nuclease-related domain